MGIAKRLVSPRSKSLKPFRITIPLYIAPKKAKFTNMISATSKLQQKFTKPLTIGNFTLKSRVLQSPLSGVAFSYLIVVLIFLLKLPKKRY